MTGEQLDRDHALRWARWGLGGMAVVGLVMVSALVYLALGHDGGTSTWVLAAVWLVGVSLIVGLGLRSLASR